MHKTPTPTTLTISPKPSSHQPDKTRTKPSTGKKSKRRGTSRTPVSSISKSTKTMLLTCEQMGLGANDDLNRLGTYKPADEGSLRAVVIDSQAAGQLVRARRQLIGLYQRTKAVDGLRPRQCIEHDRLCRLNRGDHFTRVFACSQGLHPSTADDEDSLTITSESSLDLELDEQILSDMARTALEAETMEDVGSDIESLDAQLDVDAEMSIDERFGLESTFSERLNLVTSINETTLMSWLAGQLEWANFEWLRPSTRTSEVSDS